MSRRQLLGAAAGATVGSSLAGCLDIAGGLTGNDDSSDDLRIGVLGETTYESMVTAAEVGASELNDDDGLLDRSVDIVGLETNSSPAEARRNYHRLILEEDVDVTVGISNSDVLNYLIDDIAEQQTLHFTTGIGMGISDQELQEDYDRYKYHFRTGPLGGDYFIQNQFEFVQQMFPHLGWDSVALLMEDYSWTESLMEPYQAQLEQLGIDVPYAHRYRPSIDDFSSIYDDIEGSGADVVWVAMGATGDRAVAQWAQQQRQFEFGGIHVTMQSPNYYEALEGAPRYAVTTTTATANSELTPVTPEFVDAYRRRADGSDPVYTAYNAYDSILAYAEAVETADTFDTDAVIEALKTVSIEGASGTVSYYDEDAEFPHDRTYDPTDEDHSGSVFFQWQEGDGTGVQETVWPENVATEEYVEPHWL